LLATRALAQELSPIVSFDYGSPLFINRSPNVLDTFPGTASGTSSSESYGLGVQAIGRGWFTTGLDLIGRLQAIYTTGRFSFNTIPYSITGSEVKLLLEGGVHWDITPLALNGGGWISQSIVRSILETNAAGANITPFNAASASTHAGLFAGVAWEIPNFPLRPELNTHFDLTQRAVAGSNAWSVGLSLAYLFEKIGRANAQTVVVPIPAAVQVPAPTHEFIPARVKFLVNGAESEGAPPLERVEIRVKEYRMIDAPNTPPRVTQWVDESYHLPHLAITCSFDRHVGSYLMVLKDSLRLIEKTFVPELNAAQKADTTLDLNEDSAWQHVLAHLNTGESNKLIVELRPGGSSPFAARDTLVLPPADMSRAEQTIEKNQYRFILPDQFGKYKGGRESLDLLMGRIKQLLDSCRSITIFESSEKKSNAGHSVLLQRLHAALGAAWMDARRMESSDTKHEIIVVLEN
jgi:hypothetical protein